MKLVVHELQATELSQSYTPERNVIVHAIRPHLYKHNAPAGTLKLQIYNGVTLVGESDPVTIASISTANYFHGYVRFDLSCGLKRDTAYTFKLVGSGYTFSESAYVGWCGGFDLGKYPATYTPESLLKYPLDLEVWERKAK